MKKFLINIFLFAGLIVLYKIILVSIVIFSSADVANNGYLGKTSNKPRIILVGASNMGYDYNYPTLNEHFNDFDVIGCNMCEPSGFYAIMYKLQKLKPTARDYLVFCLPYSLYETDKFLPLKNKKVGFTPALLAESFRNFPNRSFKAVASLNILDACRLFDIKAFTSDVKKDTLYFEEKPSCQEDEKYKNCWTSDKKQFFVISNNFDKEYIVELNTYIAKTFGSKCFFSFPPLKENEFTVNKERIMFLSKQYPFIDTFKNSVYPHEYWFDQWYHLNSCGRELSTKKLIADLEVVLKKN